MATLLKEAVKRGLQYSGLNDRHTFNTCPSDVIRDLVNENAARVIRIRNISFVGDVELSHIDWRGTIDLDGCIVHGDIDLSHAKMEGRLSLNETTIQMLNLAYAEINGPLIAHGLIAQRGVFALRSRVIGGIALQRAVLSAPADDSMRRRSALELYHASVGDLYLNGATLKGGLYGIGMTVERNVRLQGADIYSRSTLSLAQGTDAGDGVDLAGAEIGSSLYLTGQAGDVNVNGGTVRLTNARCRNFAVSASELTSLRLDIEGFTYATLRPATGEDVLKMLDRQEEVPFTAYRALGSYAESVGAVALQRSASIHLERRITRRGLGWWTPAGAWRRLLDWSVAYGFKPGRALIWLIACVAVESFILRWAGGFVKPKPGFVMLHAWPQAITFAADSLLPFSSLGYQSHFDLLPAGTEQWWWFTAYVAVKLAAWILAALGIAAVTGIIRQK